MLPRYPVRTALLLFALVLAGCATMQERPPTPADNQSIRAHLEPLRNGEGADIVVSNNATVDVVITSVTLRECENIRNRCEMRPLSVRVPAGQRRQVATVNSSDRSRAHSFRYSWTWEEASTQGSGS
jgi:hypothetical protein